jgi:phosphopantetheinyl transferase (holo-ACP synthase)
MASRPSVITRSRLSNIWLTWRKTISLHIGNDIVDLSDPHNMGKSKNVRFVNRVFTFSEQRQIVDSPDPDTSLWTIWAGKETAYKIISKRYAVSSSPRLYEVRLSRTDRPERPDSCFSEGKALSGLVDTPHGTCYIQVIITGDYIHCIGNSVSSEAMASVLWREDRIDPFSGDSPDFESMAVRKALKKHLSASCNKSTEDIEIRRTKGPRGLGPPFAYINGRRAEIDISLSHDGRFAAYAFVEKPDFTA